MNSIISDLWYGKVSPCATCGVGDKEIEQMVVSLGEHEDALRRLLTGSQREMFIQYARWSDMYACTILEKAFREGFCLAMRLMLDTLSA